MCLPVQQTSITLCGSYFILTNSKKLEARSITLQAIQDCVRIPMKNEDIVKCERDITNNLKFNLHSASIADVLELYCYFFFEKKVHKVALQILVLTYSDTMLLECDFTLLSAAIICCAHCLVHANPSQSIIRWGVR